MSDMLTADTLVKMLAAERMPAHGGSGQWPEPGRWRAARGRLIPCENGLHLCTIEQALFSWPAPEMWTVEYRGKAIHEPDKTVVRRARLVRRVETWNDRNLQLFAVDCAERVLPLYEREHPGDDRPRAAVEVARRYTRGEATDTELSAARDAVWAAARTAVGAAAWTAVGAAARTAAGAAARTAAGAAAWDAARAAAWDAARTTAWDAARTAVRTAAAHAAWDAAWAATWAAAEDAAGAAEHAWQVERLLAYLNGQVTA